MRLTISKVTESEVCTRAQSAHSDAMCTCRANGCPWNSQATTLAARRGHLPMLAWLRAEGCEWNEDAFARAAGRDDGGLTVLRWLHEHGCPMDATAVRAGWGRLKAVSIRVSILWGFMPLGGTLATSPRRSAVLFSARAVLRRGGG